MVPNRGFVSSLEFDEEGSDVLHSMNLIGLHGILTGREYSASIKTLTNTHVIISSRFSNFNFNQYDLFFLMKYFSILIMIN